MSDAGSLAAEQYNDGNRAFLQSFLARGTLTLKEAKPMLAAIYSVQEGSSAVKSAKTSADTFCR
jgi:hypothetical protein